MKIKEWTIIAAATLSCAACAQAAIETSASATVNQDIPDGNPSGVASTISLNVLGNQIVPGSVSVFLNISGSFSGDLFAYVTHGSGYSVLLNRVGADSSDGLGYGDFGLNVRFSDSAANGNIHTYRQVTTPAFQSQLGGTWAPDGRSVSPYAINGSEIPTAKLSSFDQIDPNGDWTLFVADVNGGDLHTLVSWGLDMSVAPEPASYGLMAGLASLVVVIRRKLFVSGAKM